MGKEKVNVVAGLTSKRVWLEERLLAIARAQVNAAMALDFKLFKALNEEAGDTCYQLLKENYESHRPDRS